MSVNQDGNQEIGATAQPARRPRRTFLLAAGGVGIVAVLGGAAYVAGNLLNPPKPGVGGGSEIMVRGGGPGGPVVKEFHSPKIKNAPEIPASEPDVAGLYLRRQDNSVFLGTGEIEMMVQKDAGGKTAANAKHSGPDVEVVVNRDTKIYLDKTPITQKDLEEGKELQQVIEPVASLDDLVKDLNTTDSLLAWGQKVGDRLIARTLLHRPPLMLGGPGPG